VSGEDFVLEQAEEDRVVSLVERDHAVKVVSFCSNHILGTALPSFGGWPSAERPRDSDRHGVESTWRHLTGGEHRDVLWSQGNGARRQAGYD
jgi:hypothetical protein